MDHLNPADMPAVVERTVLKENAENFLLPIYESISNAVYASRDKWGQDVATKGLVKVSIDTENAEFTITDNGVGLDRKNYDSFKTPFTSNRLKKAGKGFGRFIAFKVFENISYQSKYINGGSEQSRSFKFDIYAADEIIDLDEPIDLEFQTGCLVRYKGIKGNFLKVHAELASEEIVQRVVRYFLPFYMSGEMPDFKITIDGAEFDTREHFKEIFASPKKETVELEIDGNNYTFSIDIAKIDKTKLIDEHILLLFAGGRIIGTGISITGKIGTPYFENADGKKQVYVASVSGELLDARANTARTSIDISKDEFKSIVDAVTAIILEIEKNYVVKHRAGQVDGVKKAIQRNPLLRTGLKNQKIEQYVKSNPMSWKTENFVGDLALERFREQRNWDKEISKNGFGADAQKEEREKLLKHIEEENRNALASYVVHRKTVLYYANKVLGFDDDKKMHQEDIIHDLVYPRYKDSDNISFYKHNLWLIDEKLSFFDYCSSDRTLHGGRRKKGDKVADLILFEDCTIYTPEDRNCVVLIEFKKPGRDDYKYGDQKHDPIEQVKQTAKKMRDAGRIITTTGRTVDFPKGRIYAYVIADLEPTLKSVCENHDMNETWDQLGYHMYHKYHDLFIESISYDKLITDANKRNAAFFEILLGDIVN